MQAIKQRMLQCFWQKLPNAFLLAPWQSRLSSVVTWWENLILCQHPEPTRACAKCAACVLYLAGNHPDCFSHQDNSTSISIDDIRALGDFVQQTTHQGGRRIVTLLSVDQLSVGAANALLKTLEEPPSGTFFLLAALRSSRVLPTIRSRAATIVVPYPERVLPEEDRLLWEALFVQDASMPLADKLQAQCNENAVRMLHQIYYWVTDLLRAALGQPLIFAYTDKARAELAPYVERIPPSQALIFLEYVDKALQTVIIPGINKGLLLGSLLYRWKEKGLPND